MKKPNCILYCTVLALLLFSLSGCAAQTPDTSSSEEPTSTQQSREESSEPDADVLEPQDSQAARDQEAAAEQESETADTPEVIRGDAYATATVGNIQYTYDAALTVQDIGGTDYVYYSDTAFFFSESMPVPENMDTLTEEDITDFFTSAELSFQGSGWENGRIVGDIFSDDVNGLDKWFCEFEMERDGVPFVSACTLVFHDGRITTFTLITDLESYNAVIYEYAETISSLVPIPAA